ncbi:MAG: hypothetical protein A2Z03_05275 [Chloroflexi bacterium RBG_16_56_8]|nr:MAG: hypothetical protein A2Z03_05275 [Chloroflexi bacterium RBG_16_56_8]
MEGEPILGYKQALIGGKKLETVMETDEIRQAMNQGSVLMVKPKNDEEQPSIVVPIKLRGQVIGVMNIKAPSHNREWTRDEILLTEAVSERLALALENARLIQDSQRRAAKEQAIGEITAKIGASINMRNVLQTAVEELGRALPGSEVVIRFQNNNGNS